MHNIVAFFHAQISEPDTLGEFEVLWQNSQVHLVRRN